SPGAPIAYKLNYLQDNSPARMSFTTDYDVKECVRVSQKVKVTLNSIAVEDAGGDPGDDLEIYGRIWAEGTTSGALFDKSTSNAVTIREGQQFGTGGALAETVISVSPRAGESIRLRGDLRESDLLRDDSLGNETQSNPFETGWRKESTMILTGAGARVKISFSLSPI
ncbi:MAG TPA: hypothetical protein VK427_03025, partial [Kofleriaceae bacterium]|nr:hypothetical protein [Kofleriaceae bacterium]